jgi:hypothetical protein
MLMELLKIIMMVMKLKVSIFSIYSIGIGFGLIYLPAVVCVGYYFESKRAFATGFDINISILNRIFYFILIKIYFK